MRAGCNCKFCISPDGVRAIETGILQWWQPAAKSTAERVLLFTKGTRVYGDYLVIIEQSTVDTKTIL